MMERNLVHFRCKSIEVAGAVHETVLKEKVQFHINTILGWHIALTLGSVYNLYSAARPYLR
jgi:hypothetical protein